jgi:hypothetical protein
MATEMIAFANYKEETVDPGWQLLLGVLFFCAIMVGGLPFWMQCANRLVFGWKPKTKKERRTKEKTKTVASQQKQQQENGSRTNAKELLNDSNLLSHNNDFNDGRDASKSVSTKNSSNPTTVDLVSSPDVSEMSSVAVESASPQLYDIMSDNGEEYHVPRVARRSGEGKLEVSALLARFL